MVVNWRLYNACGEGALDWWMVEGGGGAQDRGKGSNRLRGQWKEELRQLISEQAAQKQREGEEDVDTMPREKRATTKER